MIFLIFLDFFPLVLNVTNKKSSYQVGAASVAQKTIKTALILMVQENCTLVYSSV